MSVSNLDNQPTLLSGMSQDDVDAIRAVEEQLMKKITLSGKSESTVLSAKDDSKSEEVQEFKQEVKEVKEDDFNISKIKDEASGYDLGAREKLEKEIAKGKSLGLDVSALVQKLEKMIAEIEREKALNADSKELEKSFTNDNSVSSDIGYFDDNDELAQMKKEAFELFQSLLSRGIINLVDMAKEFMQSDDGDEIEVGGSGYTYNPENLDEKELAEVQKLNNINTEIFEKSQQNGLIGHVYEDGDNKAFSYLIPIDHKGDKNFMSFSSEDIADIRERFKTNPNDFKIHTQTFGDDEEMISNLKREGERDLAAKFFDAISKFKSSERDFETAKIFNIPVAQEVDKNISVAVPFFTDGNEVLPQAIVHRASAVNLVEIVAKQRDGEKMSSYGSHAESFVEKITRQHESQGENERGG